MNVLNCGVMKVGVSVVSVVVMMLGRNLDDILLNLSIKNSETVDANVFGASKSRQNGGTFSRSKGIKARPKFFWIIFIF